MQNLGSILAKIAALAGGAIAGKMLAEWLSRQLSQRVREQTEPERQRYAEGLAPLDVPSANNDQPQH